MKIQGIQGYNASETVVAGESKKLPAGNYVCKILGLNVQKSKTGRDMLVVQFDISDGDYKNFYQDKYNSAKNSGQDAKYGGVLYRLMDGDNTKYYKGFLSCIEKSNNIKIDGENGFDSSLLIGKIFGGRFGEEEYEYNGDIKTYVKLRYVVDVDSLEKQPILNVKKLQMVDSYYSSEPVSEDNLPF